MAEVLIAIEQHDLHRRDKTNKTMMNLKTMALVALGLAAASVAGQGALYINLSNNTGSDIVFTGGSPTTPAQPGDFGYFQFLQGGGVHVTSAFYWDGVYGNPKVAGDSVGDQGTLGGPNAVFKYTVVDATTGKPVAPSASFRINDGANYVVGNVDFSTLKTYGPAGEFGGLSAGKAVFNLTGLQYFGAASGQQDLQFLGNAGKAILTLSYQFADPFRDLNVENLAAKDAVNQTSYSLSLVAVPEPSTYLAGLGALALFGITAFPRRKS